MNKITYILKKDLPTIRAGRVINLSDDGSKGIPSLMNIEINTGIVYEFPINILKENPDWFERFEYDSTVTPKAPNTEV